MRFRNTRRLMLVGLCLFGATGCATPQGDTRSQKRADVLQMRSEALTEAYRREPALRAKVQNSLGYAVFSGVGTHTIIVTTGNAYGVLRDNRTGRDTYMRALKLGGGLGVGVASMRVVVVFNDAQTLNNFMTQGWAVTASGEGAVKVPEGAGAGATYTLPGMEIYRFTDTGVMLSGAAAGVKVWRDDDLN